MGGAALWVGQHCGRAAVLQTPVAPGQWYSGQYWSGSAVVDHAPMPTRKTPIQSAAVAAVAAGYPPAPRRAFAAISSLSPQNVLPLFPFSAVPARSGFSLRTNTHTPSQALTPTNTHQHTCLSTFPCRWPPLVGVWCRVDAIVIVIVNFKRILERTTVADSCTIRPIKSVPVWATTE